MTPDFPVKYGASYKSTTLLGVNGSEAVFTPAANARGGILHRFAYSGSSSSNFRPALIAKTSAPTGPTDGDVIAGKLFPNNTMISIEGDQEIFIPAGKGLYFLADAAEVNTYKNAIYTLL